LLGDGSLKNDPGAFRFLMDFAANNDLICWPGASVGLSGMIPGQSKPHRLIR